MAESDFLYIEGVEGESSDANHGGWIEVQSYSWGVRQMKTAVAATGKPVPSKADFDELHITKLVDQSSTDLIKKCIIPTPLIPEVKLDLCIAGTTHEPYMTFTMKNAIVSSINYVGGGDGEPSEDITICYEDITIEYKPYEGGTRKGQKVVHWNLKTNSA